MERPTLQQILNHHYPAYEQSHPLPGHVRAAVQAAINCRTAALGGHIQACPDGHVHGVWYNSCRHRFCAQCAHLQTARWLEQQQARLLACDYYHVIFTLPHELNALWRANPEGLPRLLFDTVRETLFELLGDPRYLGALPGVIAALHTWGQTLTLHPHIHCLVSGGGWQGERWVPLKRDYLLPGAVVRPLYRGKLLAALRQALERGELSLPPGVWPQQLHNLFNRLGRKKWNVRLQERYPHGQGVLNYLARYLRGGPLSNARLIAWDGQTVTFRYRDNHHQGEPARMTLPVEDFLQRLFWHVPLPGRRVVRSWGLYAPAQRQRLDQARAHLGQAPVGRPEPLDWQRFCAGQGERHPERCPVCGQALIRRDRLPPHPSPRRLERWPVPLPQTPPRAPPVVRETMR